MESRTRVYILVVAVLTGSALTALPAAARVLISQKDALAVAFPKTKPERRTAYLTDAQATAVEEAAQSKLESKVWTYYVSGSTTAYFESHLVRTMNETVMIVVNSNAVAFVEILSFSEPDEYLASKRWLGQFPGRKLDDDLALRRGLRGIAGATMTAEAVTRSVRRVLAIHQVLNAKPPK